MTRRLARTGARLARSLVTALAEEAYPSALVTIHDSTVAIGTPPRTLVDRLSLTLREGDRLAILGENGSGKTVTAQLLGRAIGGSADGVKLTPSSAVACSAGVGREGRAVVHVSFESHRRLLQSEVREYRESRFDVTHLRATLASYLFPELRPDLPHPNGFAGYTPKEARLAPLPVPYDADAHHPGLAALEAAVTRGEAGELLRQFGLYELRHRPLFAMSTGEARKTMVVDCLLSPPQLLVLDEAFDGLDSQSRDDLREVLLRTLDADGGRRTGALALIAHHPDDLVPPPTHALLLGQGEGRTGFLGGEWREMAATVGAYFDSQRLASSARPPRPRLRRGAVAAEAAAEAAAATIVDFREVTVQYATNKVFDRLRWKVREREKWVVLGGNGSGKSTIIELITGDNLQGFRQDMWLFGRKKGSGESIWDIKKQLGVLSTEFHMDYIDYADPSINRNAASGGGVTSWEVVLSGFFDSVGLRGCAVTPSHEQEARRLVERLGLQDLISHPPPRGCTAASASASASTSAASAGEAGRVSQTFFHLSHGQQKLVLLCRALVKRPRLLLLDEPTHGLSGHNRERLLETLASLADDAESPAVVYVTHRSDEIEALDYENVLQLTGGAAADGSGWRVVAHTEVESSGPRAQCR